ncbi:MAG: helix-turn-helix transcriptional regulator [Betaproteobacteria bacterium]|nr:helix-turn-helix transcriptional regulator [Betaproteobacteria bacterium]
MDPRTDAFLALIRQHVSQETRSMSDLAEVLGISRRQLGRMLNGLRPLRVAELEALTDLLGIDRARARVAIELIGDWQAYDDPGLGVMMRLLEPVVTRLRDRAEVPVQPLTKPAQERLSIWIADTILTNDGQIRNRQEAFMKLPDI